MEYFSKEAEKLWSTEIDQITYNLMLIEAIGSKKRLMILKTLSKGDKCVSELMRELKMDGKTAKYHSDVLERSGLIESKIVGKRNYYTLKKEIKLEISPPPHRKFILIAQEAQNTRCD